MVEPASGLVEAPLDVAPEQDRQTLARRATGMRFEPPPWWGDQEVRGTARGQLGLRPCPLSSPNSLKPYSPARNHTFRIRPSFTW